jgi:hypothetical protein
VTCRHEPFDVVEVARVLVDGGWFVTQQVDIGNDNEYKRLMGVPPEPSDPSQRLEAWLPQKLADAGFEVVEHGSAPLVQIIRDAGALAWNLKAISWMVPGFTIPAFRDRLREIQTRIDRDGPLIVKQRRFWTRARKVT